MSNKKLWNDLLGVHFMDDLDDVNAKGATAPMLVVCYTNHALDQFLEGKHSKWHQTFFCTLLRKQVCQFQI